VEGLLKNGMSEKKAEELWALIEPFAAYGFNKAHAASYGHLAYKTAYMKANFPVPYMTAILTAESGDVERVSEIIHECKKMEIEVLPPHINECFGNFTVIKNEGSKLDKIRFGFYTIKNLGTDISDAIIEERKKNGPFASMESFLERVQHKNLTKKSLEALIKAGAMDDFGDRGTFLQSMEELLAFTKSFSKVDKNQGSLFGGDNAPKARLQIKEGGIAGKEEKLVWEKELLGLYISGHPLERVQEKIDKNGMHFKRLHEMGHQNMNVVSAAIIDGIRKVITKKGGQMAFVKLSDMTGSMESVIFPDTFREFATILVEQKCVAFKGKLSIRDGEKSITIESLKEI
jgi:DNA polymerase-3 subunit alpha